ncbi:hypothetical protein U1Q18_005115 [Sarracenia purpurea var. burkii]
MGDFATMTRTKGMKKKSLAAQAEKALVLADQLLTDINLEGLFLYEHHLNLIDYIGAPWMEIGLLMMSLGGGVIVLSFGLSLLHDGDP